MALKNFKGYLLAAVAAAAYGTNPVFAIPLYEHGMNPNSRYYFIYSSVAEIISEDLFGRVRHLKNSSIEV